MNYLVYESMTDVVMMDKKRIPDGEGGFISSGWIEGVQFRAAISHDASTTAKIAESQGVTSLYTVTIPKNAELSFHDVFKRLSDGKIFRVTSDSDDMVTPDIASFEFRQVSAEEWQLS